MPIGQFMWLTRKWCIAIYELSNATQEEIAPMFNVSYRKVGGPRFLKIGRLCFSWCVTAEYKPFKA
jgi:hypothetical protein